MAPSIRATNPISASKSAVGSFHRPISVPVDASSLALSTAAAVAAITSNCPNQRSAPTTATSSSGNIQRQLHPNSLVPSKGIMNQIYPHQRQSNNLNVPQHHLVMNPIHLSPAYPLHNKYTTHSVFTNMKLRRGKWTQEEERFANALIEEFEKGTIQDCENGCTLRAFLSRKLHCAPMRISKKYAGKSIGKHVFLSRNSTSPHSHQQAQLITPTLRRLEFQFHMSLVQEGSPGMEHDNRHLNQTLMSGNEYGHIVPGYPMAFRSNILNNDIGTIMNIPHPCQGLPNQPTIFQWPITGVPQANIPPPTIASMPNNAMHIQQSLFTTFKDAHKLSSTPSQHLPTTSLINACHAGVEELQVTAVNGIEQIGIRTSGGKNYNSSEHDCYSKVVSDQQLVITNEPLSTHVINNVTVCDANDSSHYSPKFDTIKQQLLPPLPLTNQLHQLKQVSFNQDSKLDKLMPGTVGAVLSINKLTPAPPVPQTDALLEDPHLSIGGIKLRPSVMNNQDVIDDTRSSGFLCESHLSADAYALFAQQSAMAVSKHSAYCFGDTVASQSEVEPIVMTAAKILDFADSEIVHASKLNSSVTVDVGVCSPSSPSQNETRQIISTPANNGAVFNATNLQIHLREAEEKARVDQASIVTRNTTCDNTKHTSINLGGQSRHVNLISGSEQSSDMSAGSTEGSTRVSCSGPGSDNSSEDSASDDITNSGTASKMALSRERNMHYSTGRNVQEIGESQMKRQKRTVLIMDV